MLSLFLNVFVKILTFIIAFKYRIYKSVFVNFFKDEQKGMKNPPHPRGIDLIRK